MDFITNLPKVKGYYALFTVTDRFTKMVHLLPTWSTATAKDTAELGVRHVIRLHGIPEDIVSDRDTKFTNHLWRSIMKILNVKLNMSSTAHPQSDGQSERTNRTVIEMLRSYVSVMDGCLFEVEARDRGSQGTYELSGIKDNVKNKRIICYSCSTVGPYRPRVPKGETRAVEEAFELLRAAMFLRRARPQPRRDRVEAKRTSRDHKTSLVKGNNDELNWLNANPIHLAMTVGVIIVNGRINVRPARLMIDSCASGCFVKKAIEQIESIIVCVQSPHIGGGFLLQTIPILIHALSPRSWDRTTGNLSAFILIPVLFFRIFP